MEFGENAASLRGAVIFVESEKVFSRSSEAVLIYKTRGGRRENQGHDAVPCSFLSIVCLASARARAGARKAIARRCASAGRSIRFRARSPIRTRMHTPVTSFPGPPSVPKGTEPDPRGIALAPRLSVPFLLDRYARTGRHVSQSAQVSLRGL